MWGPPTSAERLEEIQLMEEAHLEACCLRGSQTPAAFISCILKDSQVFIQQAFLIKNQDLDLVRGRGAITSRCQEGATEAPHWAVCVT